MIDLFTAVKSPFTVVKRLCVTTTIVCARQYPVITGVLKIGCESRVT